MPRSIILALLLGASTALSVAGGSAHAQSVAAPAAPAPEPALFTPRVKPTPMVAELLQSVEVERTQIAELRRSLASSRSSAHRLDLQRRIERIKLEGEVARIRVQIGYAQREGRRTVAESLEQALQMIQPPTTPGQSVARPSSDAR